MLGEPEAPGDALDVRVHGKALVDAESAPQDHVGRLAGHAGQFDEVLHGVGRFAVEFLHDELRGGYEVFRLAVIEPDGVDDFLELGDGGLGEGRRIGPAAEEFGRDLVHALVRALGGEYRGDEQFPRAFGYEMGFEIGIAFGEQLKDFCSPLFVCHGRFLHSGWRAVERGNASRTDIPPGTPETNHKIGRPKSQAVGPMPGPVSEETSRPCGSAVHSPDAYISVSISSNSGETKMTGSGPCSIGACTVGFSVSQRGSHTSTTVSSSSNSGEV